MELFMYSYFNDKLPSYFTNYFKLNEKLHSYNTRTASNIHIDYKRTNYGKFSLNFRGRGGGGEGGAHIWNKLPKDLKIFKSHTQFKKLIRVCAKSCKFRARL